MIIADRDKIIINTEQDVILLKNRLSELCQKLNMSIIDRTKLLTASSELSRNIIKYAGKGEAMIDIVLYNNKKGIRITFTDKGPGIKDISLAMQDGYSMSSGLGIGLPGSKRLSDDFSIESEPGKGTVVSIIKWKNE
jgi:serine/threonine-protein kinase RsbT